jgi:acyl carrier protein
MSNDEILGKVQDVVRDQLDDDGIIITTQTIASSVEGWDSLAHVRIMIAIEEEFGFQFQTFEINSLQNVGELVGLIKSRI